MNSKMNTWGKSRIRKKIVSRIVIIGGSTFIIILILAYLMLLPPLKEQAMDNAYNASSQIIWQTDFLLSSIRAYAEDIISSTELKRAFSSYKDNPTSNQTYQIVCLSLNKLASLRPYLIRNIIIESYGGKVFTSIVQVEDSDLDLLESTWYKNLRPIDYASGFSSVDIIPRSNQEDIYTAAYCKNFFLYGRRLTITIFFDLNEIINTSKSLALRSLDNYIWLDSSHIPFYSYNITEWNDEITQKLTNTTLYKSETFEEFGGYNLVNISDESGWIFVSFVSESSLFNTFKGYFFTILSLILLFFLMTVLILTPIINNITRPISQLASDMSKVAKGNLNFVSTINAKDEIGDLSRIFNKMVRDLKKYVHKLLEKEKLEQRMKYSLLISQIDPHFIYNTMSAINYLSRNGRNKDIVTINTALIKILQDRLRVSSIEAFDTVEQEINITKQYLIIQMFRYSNNLEITWDVDKSLILAQIPKNIIQPLVENALFHGLTDEEDGMIKGCIKVSIKSVENRIIIKVSDNGRGIDPEKLAQLNAIPSSLNREERGKHVGLANIRERLSYLYDNDDCMLIESEPFKETCVTINLKIK